ncbi:uncharacterized protein [Rhodnius prolixus]
MSAAILILITLSQLMLTPSASILTEVINDVTLLKNELNTFMAQDGNTTARSASGQFVRPRKVVDTTIIKNKLHELQNNVTKLAEAISNKNQNVDDIKNTIFSLEKQIEDLNKLFDNKDRETTQTLAKFQNILSDLLAKYKHREQEIAKLQYEEFLAAIKHKYYQFAAVKFVSMKNETSAINLVRSVFEELGDLLPMLEFADHVNDLKRKLLIYRTIVYSIKSNTSAHCYDCNVLLIYRKVMDIYRSKVITAGELEQIFLQTIMYIISRPSCWAIGYRYSMKKNPEWIKFVVKLFCSSNDKLGPGIQDYSGYCYPIDSIYGILQ